MDDLSENQGLVLSVARQFSRAANFFNLAAELSTTPSFGLDPVKASLNRWAGKLKEVAGEILSRGVLDDSHLLTVNFIAQEALSMRKEIGNNLLQRAVFDDALTVLTGAKPIGTDNRPVSVGNSTNRKIRAIPERGARSIGNSNVPAKLAA